MGIMSRLKRMPHLIHYCASKTLKGETDDLVYFAYMRLNKVDLSLVKQHEINIPIERANWSSSTGGPSLERVFNEFRIMPNDAIIDIGCGKGGAIITLAKYPFEKIAGVELSPILLKIAQDNFKKLEIFNIYLHCCDASDFLELDEYNYIYMANPFPCSVMKEVVSNISDSLVRTPRRMTIIYKYPVCHSQIIESSLFKHIAVFGPYNHRFFIYEHDV
jgi:SAM-dependent methyltransferase